MITLFILATLLAFGYAAYIKLAYDVTSISESYYMFQIKYNKGWIFSAWCIVLGFIALPLWLEVTPESYQFVAFLSVVALGVVGLSPKYLTSQKIAHIVSALVWATLSVIWCLLSGYWWVLLIFIAFGLAMERYTKLSDDRVYWLEVSAIGALFSGIGLNLIFM